MAGLWILFLEKAWWCFTPALSGIVGWGVVKCDKYWNGVGHPAIELFVDVPKKTNKHRR